VILAGRVSVGEPRAAPYDTAAAADSDHRERIDDRNGFGLRGRPDAVTGSRAIAPFQTCRYRRITYGHGERLVGWLACNG